jgi:hypothetical protein
MHVHAFILLLSSIIRAIRVSHVVSYPSTTTSSTMDEQHLPADRFLNLWFLQVAGFSWQDLVFTNALHALCHKAVQVDRV